MAIAIIGNVGNVGYAIPMVSATPTDITKQYALGWDPTNQALNYIPLTVDAIGNMSILGSLQVVGTITGGAGLVLTGAITATGAVVSNSTITAGAPATPANQVVLVNGATPQINVGNVKVVGTRDTGWTVGTGTPQKATFATGAVTLPQLAGVVLSLQTALIAHGLIGP